jgi:hypothetical protein
MASNIYDIIQCSVGCASRRIVRHKNPKDSGANADAYSIAQTSEALGEETHSHAIAYRFA